MKHCVGEIIQGGQWDCCVGGGWRVVVAWWSGEREEAASGYWPCSDQSMAVRSQAPGRLQSGSSQAIREMEKISTETVLTASQLIIILVFTAQPTIHRLLFILKQLFVWECFYKKEYYSSLSPSFIHGIYFGLTEADTLKCYYLSSNLSSGLKYWVVVWWSLLPCITISATEPQQSLAAIFFHLKVLP